MTYTVRNKVGNILMVIAIIVAIAFQSHNNILQAQVKPPEPGVYIDPRLDEFVLDYVVEAHKRGVEVDSLINAELRAIIAVDNLKFPTLGYHSSERRTILVNEHMFIEKIIMRRIVFHELGHALTVKMNDPHVCYGCNAIMSEVAPPSFYYLVDDELWQNELDVFFEWLCDNLKK